MSMASTVRAPRESECSIGRPPSPGVRNRSNRPGRAATLDRRKAGNPPRERRSAGQASRAYDAAFVEAYQTYYAKIFSFVYSRVGNVELAKDLTAEVFEKAYVKGHSVREAAAYTTWLFMIARNHVVGHYRWRQREERGVGRMKESHWLADRPQDPGDRVIESERVGHLMRHVRSLCRRDQELLSLRFDAELTSEEVAQVMGMKAMNVRVYIHRALGRLRRRMNEEPA